MGLNWALYDLDNRPIGPLTERKPGGNVKVALNGKREASVSLSLRDDVAADVTPLNTVLKAALDGELIFAAPITACPRNGRDRTVQITAIDTFRLEHSHLPYNANDPGVEPDFVNEGKWRWIGFGQVSIMLALLDLCRPTTAGVPDIPIVVGHIENEYPRDRTYEEGKQLWEAWTQMSGVTNGPDFELVPVQRTDAYLLEFRSYIRQGTDKSGSVVFEFGTGSSNAVDFVYDPATDNIANRPTIVGSAVTPAEGELAMPAPRRTANQYESQLAYGIYTSYEGRSDVIEQATVTDIALAQAAMNGWPVNHFDIKPSIEGRAYDPDTGAWETGYGIPPRFGPSGDYWVGDDVRAIGRLKPGLDEDLIGRVTDATVTEVDQAGHVQVEITCAPRVTAAGVF